MQLVDLEEGDDEVEENYAVLKIEGEEEHTNSFFKRWIINENRFETMIDSGSLVTIFALDEMKRTIKRETLQVRKLIKGEEHVNCNRKLFNPPGLLPTLLYSFATVNE